MRHQRRKRVNLNRGRRIGVFTSLLKGLVDNGRVVASEARIRQVQRTAEKLITLAKAKDLAGQRRIISVLKDQELTRKLVNEIAPRYAERPGGYTRLLKLPPREGDGCPLALLVFLP